MSRVASRMGRLGTETAMAISVEAGAHAAAGNRVFPFHLGDLNLPTPAPVREAASAALEAGHTGYCPAAGIPALREALAARHGLDAARIVCGAGSDELIGLLCQAYAGPGDEVLYSEHGFLMYPIAAKAAGASPVFAPEKNLTADVEALLGQVNDNTRLLILANPNNPTEIAFVVLTYPIR